MVYFRGRGQLALPGPKKKYGKLRKKKKTIVSMIQCLLICVEGTLHFWAHTAFVIYENFDWYDSFLRFQSLLLSSIFHCSMVWLIYVYLNDYLML